LRPYFELLLKTFDGIALTVNKNIRNPARLESSGAGASVEVSTEGKAKLEREGELCPFRTLRMGRKSISLLGQVLP